MNIWTKAKTRWTKEQIASWSSVYKTVYLLFPVLIYYLAEDVTEILLCIAVDYIGNNLSENFKNLINSNVYTFNAVIYTIGISVSLIILKTVAANEIKYVEEHKEKNNKLTPLRWLEIILLALGLSIGLNFLLSYIGLTSISSSFESTQNSQFGIPFAVGIVLFGIFSPLVEEVIFRGIIFNRLKRTFPLIIAYICGAVLFGLFHGNIVQGIYGTIMGLFIIWIYDRYETIMAPIVVHAVANVGIYVLNYTIWR